MAVSLVVQRAVQSESLMVAPMAVHWAAPKAYMKAVAMVQWWAAALVACWDHCSAGRSDDLRAACWESCLAERTVEKRAELTAVSMAAHSARLWVEHLGYQSVGYWAALLAASKVYYLADWKVCC